MIQLSLLPCAYCKHSGGIKWAGKSEDTEFIYCMIAEDEDAKNLLQEVDMKYRCQKYKLDDRPF